MMEHAIASLRGWFKRPGVRRVFRIAGLVFVVCGATWSAVSLDLAWSEVSIGLLLLNLLLLAPAISVVAAISLRINATALGHEIPHRRSLYTVAVANVSELLPIPAGAFIRGAALVNAGASVADSARIVTYTSVLTLLMTLCLSLVALGVLADAVWFWLAGASGIGLVVIVALLLRRIRAVSAVEMIGIRVLLLGLTLLRLVTAFATFGVTIGWVDAALYAIAPTLGAAVAIVPAGLGVNEAIAAGLATLIAASSASAFLAIALNRVLDLVAGGAVVFVFQFLTNETRP